MAPGVFKEGGVYEKMEVKGYIVVNFRNFPLEINTFQTNRGLNSHPFLYPLLCIQFSNGFSIAF